LVSCIGFESIFQDEFSHPEVAFSAKVKRFNGKLLKKFRLVTLKTTAMDNINLTFKTWEEVANKFEIAVRTLYGWLKKAAKYSLSVRKCRIFYRRYITI
jgi:hypothetical protein